MKKFYAFIAAALMSVSVFADKNVVPDDAVLEYETGKVGVCIYVPGDMACNDIVFVGTYHANEKGDWITAPVSDLAKFEPVDGYDGWYFVQVEDESASPEGKPVMLDVDGKFNWEYQIGSATKIRGGVTVVEGAYSGEIDLKTYGKDAVNVYTVDSWKTNPCTAIYHNYTFTVISDGCDGYACPFIVGSFTGWAFEQMQYDVQASTAMNADVYVYYKKTAEESPFQVVCGLWDEQGNIGTQPNWNDDSYLQQYVNGQWIRIPGESGDNLLTHQDANITIDVRVDTLRWGRCVNEPAEYTVAYFNLPKADCPQSVEIIGTFDSWQGTALEHLDNGWWFVELEAKASQYFKFRTAGLWPNDGGQELEVYNAVDDEWSTIKDNQYIFGQLWEDDSYKSQPCKMIELDFSDPDNYRWSEKTPTAIENVVLTEKAKKVVVDGVVYIVRNNKMFNLQGAQVR